MIKKLILIFCFNMGLQAMESQDCTNLSDTNYVEFGDQILSFIGGRRTMGTQANICPSCTICGEPLFGSGLVTRLTCSFQHEVHHACLKSIHKSGVCPECKQTIPEFSDAKFSKFVQDLTQKRRSLKELEDKIQEFSELLNLISLGGAKYAEGLVDEVDTQSQDALSELQKQKAEASKLEDEVRSKLVELKMKQEQLELRQREFYWTTSNNEKDYKDSIEYLDRHERQLDRLNHDRKFYV